MACHYLRNSRNMVSLSDDGRRSGGFFFDGSNADTEDLMSVPDNVGTLGTHDTKLFRKLYTTPVICLLMLAVVVFEVELFLLPFYAPHLKLNLTPYSILVYSHAGLWFICLLCDCFFRRQHRISRMHGYLEFYRKTRGIRRLPMIINSGGNVLILVLTCLLWDYCEAPSKMESCSGLSLTQSNFLQILGSCEMLAMFIVLLIYFVRTLRFNHTRAMPDVQEEEAAVGFLPAHSGSEIGFRDETFLDEVLEKQADMIKYLKQHNVHLGKKIIHLQNQIEGRT